MNKDLFAVKVGLLTLPLPILNEVLDVHSARNKGGEPWTRERPTLCATSWQPSLKDSFKVIETAIRAWCGHSVMVDKSFELVIGKGQFIPPHQELCDLSAHLVLQNDNPNKAQHRNYAGCVGICHPAGAYGRRGLPWESAGNECIYLPVGTLVVFPSYLTHFFFPNEADNPVVTLGLDLNLKETP